MYILCMETDWLLSIAHLDFFLDVRHRDPGWEPEGSASRDSHFLSFTVSLPIVRHRFWALGPF